MPIPIELRIVPRRWISPLRILGNTGQEVPALFAVDAWHVLGTTALGSQCLCRLLWQLLAPWGY